MNALLSAVRPAPVRAPIHPIIDGNRRMREMRDQALWMLLAMAVLMGSAVLSALLFLMVR